MDKQKQYKIVVDTNIIFYDHEDNLKKVFGTNLYNLEKFVSEKIKNVKICLPEMVINERIAKLLEIIEKIKSGIDERTKKLEVFGIKTGSDYKEKDYEKILIEHKDKIIKDNKFEILKNPTCSIDEISKRAINKIPPFKNSDKGDNGYKDTIIWKSIIEDAEKHKDTNYILVTKNISDFKHECLEREFKDVSSVNLSIVEDLAQLKEFFDKELDLKLGLEKLHGKILNKVLTHSGKIIFDIHKGDYLYNFGSLIGSSDVYASMYRFGHKGKLASFEPLKYDLDNLSTKDDNIYNVVLIIEGQGLIRSEEKQSNPYDVVTGGFLYDHSHVNELVYGTAQVDVLGVSGIESMGNSIEDEKDAKYSYLKQNVSFVLEIKYNNKKNKIESIKIYPRAPLELKISPVASGLAGW